MAYQRVLLREITLNTILLFCSGKELIKAFACCSIPLYLPKKKILKWILLFKDEECDFCWTRTFKLKYMLTIHGLQSLCEFWFYIYIFECCIAWLFPVNKTILPFNNLIQLRQLPNNYIIIVALIHNKRRAKAILLNKNSNPFS